MESFTQAILQIGVAPAIAGYLLYDYSKKIGQIQILLTKQELKMDEQKKLLEELLEKCRGEK